MSVIHCLQIEKKVYFDNFFLAISILILINRHNESNKEGKDQESIYSGTTPDPGPIWESVKSTRKHNLSERQEVSPFPAGERKAVINRQNSVTKTKTKHNEQRGSTKGASP